MDRPIHPLQEELTSRGLTYEAAATVCWKLGWRPRPSADYLKNICRGWNGPGPEFAEFLSMKFSEGRVSYADIRNYPYSRSRKRKSQITDEAA